MNFKEIAEVLEQIEPVSSRIEIRNILKSFLTSLNAEDIDKTIYILQGEFFRPYEGIELNVGQSIIEESIAKAYGFSKSEVSKQHIQDGDLGKTAEYFAKQKRQKSIFSRKLAVSDVYDKLRQIASETGKSCVEMKLKHLGALMQNTSPLESKYMIKIIAGNLRVKLGVQTIIETVALIELEKSGIKDYKENMSEFNKIKSEIEYGYNISNDLGFIVKIVLTQGLQELKKIKICIGVPLKSALAEREKGPEQIIKRLGKCIVESKYDGFRLQVHHKKGFTRFYSRRSEDLTAMFPDLLSVFENVKEEFIIDSEAIGFDPKTKTYLNFQATIKRKRKYDVKEKAEEIPVLLHIFDVLYYNGKETVSLPLQERRKLVENLCRHINSKIIIPTNAIFTDDAEELMTFFKKSIDSGLEGIIAKDLNKPYIVGMRDFAWIKLKKNYLEGQADSIDLCIIGYFLGTGKYANKPSSLLCAIYSYDGRYKAVAKVASGLAESDVDYFNKEFEKMKLLEKPVDYLTALEPNFYVEPKFVIEVVCDEITKSPLYKTGDGFSLRFPRFISIREDKSSDETTSENELRRLFELQYRKK